MRIVVLCLLAVAGAYAQNATLSGMIKDSSGAAVPHAPIVVTSDEMGIKHNLQSNEAGYYSLPALIPGTYRITVAAPGFQTAVRENIKLEVAQNANLDIQLELGRVEQTVKVDAAAAAINTADGSVSTVIDRDFVENMPLNGRSFNSLVELTPGAIMVPTTEASRGTYAINGQRSDGNYYTVDGVSANLGVSSSAGVGQGGGGASVGTSSLGGTNNLVSIDALQEFRISTSTYAPEYGRGPGGQIAIVTRSGNNQYHGTLFEYLRNDKLDANDWFANRSGLKRPAERQNDFGGVLGGPVVKNRTFFFFSYEGLRLVQPATLISDVPSLDFRQQAPAKLQPYLNAFPLPTGPDEIDPKTHLLNGYAPFTATASDPSDLNATSLRVDHMLTSNIQLFARYNYAPSSSSLRASLGGPSTITEFDSGMQTATVGAVAVLSPTITNDFRINYSMASGSRHFTNDNFGGGTPLPDSAMFPAGYSSSNSAYEFRIASGTLTSFFQGDLAQNWTRQYNIVDSVSTVQGAHQMKFGIDWRRVDTRTNSFNLENLVTFNDTGTISPIAGTVMSGLGAASLNSTVDNDMIFKNFSAYAQDTWKVHSRLTLTYGIRWDVNPPPTLAKGNLFAVTQISDPSNLALAPSGTPLYKAQYGKFAPRIGIAYQLTRNPQWMTVIRSGFGMFYDTAYGRQATLLDSPPLTNSAAYSNVAIPMATITVPVPVTTLPFTNFVALAPNLDLPVTYQWNFSIDQEVGNGQSVAVSYVGAAGRNLFVGEQYANLNNSFIGGTIIGDNNSSSDYNSLQMQYQRRFTRGLQVLLSYDWSHSIDTASNDTVNVTHGSDFYPTQNRGDSDFDVRHSFTAALVYQVPVSSFGGHVGRAILGGWAIDPLLRSRTPLPVDITNSRTIGKVSAITRVNLVPGQPLYINDPTVPEGRRFNPLAFTIPSGFVQGTFGRNVMRGFDMNQADLAVNRNFKLHEQMKLQFRAEFFNVLNHPNFANPNGAYSTSTTFGVVTAMLNKGLNSASGGGFNALYQNGGPRSVQMSMKLTF